MSYIPKVGDSVSAKRKIKTNGIDCVIGPIVAINRDEVVIEANLKFFTVSTKEWKLSFLHVSPEFTVSLVQKIALRLSGLYREAATIPERQIADLLVENGYLSLDENDNYIVR
jgi:hypothetical protein